MSDDATPFRFGLERVRDVRVHAERAAQEVLAGSLMARRRVQDALAEAEASLAAARTTPAGPLAEDAPLTGSSLVARQAWVQRLERGREQAARSAVAAEAQVGRDREGVLAAARRREALDKLRDRRRAEHTLAAGRAESVRMDEIALQRAARTAAAAPGAA